MDSPEEADRAPVSAEPQPAEDLEDRWRRAVAELDNYRKRCARQIEVERANERARVAGMWLSVLDDLERALRFAKLASESSSSAAKLASETSSSAAKESDQFMEGIRSVRDQAVGLLAAVGYPRDDETGVAFDPFRHEAVSVADDADAPPGTVIEVVRPGYGKGEHQLRPAAVVVAGQRG